MGESHVNHGENRLRWTDREVVDSFHGELAMPPERGVLTVQMRCGNSRLAGTMR